MLLFHLANPPMESIGRMIYEEQRKLELPNSLVSECRTILAKINVRESLLKCLTKSQFRKIIHEKLIDAVEGNFKGWEIMGDLNLVRK